jgi:hypothetical protein
MAASDVPLRGGPAVPVAVVDLLLALADRGVELRPEPDGAARLSPAHLVTADEWTLIRGHVTVVRAVAHYFDAVCAWPLASIGTRLAPSLHPPARPAVEPCPARASSPTEVPPAPVAEPRQLALHAEAD